jgi:preprotein translocase subunit SecF
MEFLRQTNIDFMGMRKVAYAISGTLALMGIISLLVHGGLRYGIDFAGGTVLQVRFAKEVTVQEVRSALATVGFDQAEIQLSHDVQQSGHPEIMIRAGQPEGGVSVGEVIKGALTRAFGDSYEVRREELVGPKIGGELRRDALWAIVFSLGGILIYMSWRFHFRSGVAAIVALFHDVLITVGAISITNKEMTLPVLAALLTLVGYSLNDTIVVFDRIREDRRLAHREPLIPLVNGSINRTLSRTLITAGTTLMVVVFLFFMGGEVLHDFAFALLVGILVGTYSSIFVASAVWIEWETRLGVRRAPVESKGTSGRGGGAKGKKARREEARV